MLYDRTLHTETARILEQNRLINEKKLTAVISEYAEDFAGILNSTRQFVMLNESYFGNPEIAKSMLGKRPGDVFGCIHADNSGFGCGCGTACSYCGAVSTVVEALETRRKVTRDSRLLVGRNGEETLNIRVKAVPLDFEDEIFILLFIRDISREKRVELMEQAFFHDVLNSSVSLQSLVSVSKVSSELVPDADRSIELNISDIVEQIQYFRKLKEAEEGELVVENSFVDYTEELRELVRTVRETPYAEGKEIELGLPEQGIEIFTDRILVRRIILNLLKNALEASRAGEAVRVSLRTDDSFCILSVGNQAVMPEEVRAQIFQRSFSTKGSGRGIGTYSVKMLGERYLGGLVDFSSGEGAGTVFRFRIPLYND